MRLVALANAITVRRFFVFEEMFHAHNRFGCRFVGTVGFG